MKTQIVFFNIVVLCLVVCAANSFAQAPPRIVDFTPKRSHYKINTNSGGIIKIIGSGFAPDSSHREFFGPIRGNTGSFVNDTITTTAAAGATYEPITVTLSDRGTVTYSRIPFKVIMAGSTIGFERKVRFGPGKMITPGFFLSHNSNVACLVAAALDSNGQAFLATYTAQGSGGPFIIGNYGRAPLITPSRELGLVARGDFDADAYQDAVMTTNDPGSARLNIFHCEGNPGGVKFNFSVEYPLPGRSSGIAVQDLDGDGHVDIAVAMKDSNCIEVFRNTSTAHNQFSFDSPLRLITQGEPAGIAIGDINGDALPEIVVTEKNLNQVVIFRNAGNMNFVPVRFGFGNRPDKVRLLDIDGPAENDRPLDIITTNPESGVITARLNTTQSLSNITLGSAYTIDAGGTDIVDLDIQDLDGDSEGRLDIVVANHRRNSISIITNTTSGPGSISFAPPVEFAAGRGPRSVVICDFNLNGYHDIAVAGDADTCTTGDCSDIVFLNGRRFLPEFSGSRNSIPMPATLVGETGIDTIVVKNNASNLNTTILDVRASVSGTRFHVSPNGIQSIGPIGTQDSLAFVITFTPQDTLIQNDTLTFSHNGIGSPARIPLRGKGLSHVSPPSLLSPALSSTNVDPALFKFAWSRAATATRYHLQVALDNAFNTLVAETSTPDSTTFVSPLAYNTKYYWHVASTDVNGEGLFSQTYSFSTTSAALLSGQVFFPPNPAADTSYRLVSIPGASRLTVGDLLTGTQGFDWRIFRENGEPRPNDLTELSASDLLRNAEGYLMLRRGTFNFSRNVLMSAISTNGTYNLPLEKRWVIIGNPFEKEVKWASVLAASNLPARALSTYSGSGGMQTDSIVRPFVGYLLDNAQDGVDTLRFPYPFPMTTSPSMPSIPVVWKLQLVFETEGKLDRENYVGISTHASVGRDALEEHKPPLFLNKGTISFARPQWDETNSLFASDFRPALGEGQVWEFNVRNDRMSKAKIRIVGMDQIPAENEITLVNSQNTMPINMRQHAEYGYQTVSSEMEFKLIVGKKEFTLNELQAELPTEFRLEQNYPNPFNPSTSISFSVPKEADVKLEIVSLLGQRVAVLGEDRYQPGTYTLVWNPANVHSGNASGVYFYRFIVNGSQFGLRKMLLLK